MLATVGWIVADFFKLPGTYVRADGPPSVLTVHTACLSPSSCLLIRVSSALTQLLPHSTNHPQTGDVHQVSSLAAHDVAVKSGALAQILIWTSIAEAISVIAITQMLEGSGRKVLTY